MAGVPIYPTRGRGGGWQLVGGARTDLTGLTEGEVTSLLVGLAQSATAEPERIAAVRKLVGAAPAPFRESAQRVAEATVRDVPWGSASDAGEARTVAELQKAIARSRCVRFEYAGTRGQGSVTLVPLVVGSRGSRWYLLGAQTVAESGTADLEQLRTYRADRIRAVELVRQSDGIPTKFDAREEWARMVDRVEGLRGAVQATIRVEPWALRALRDRFGAQARVLDTAPDAAGRSKVMVGAHRTDALAEQLAGWTAAIEVTEPQEVRAALRDLGERIVAMYSDPADGAGSSPTSAESLGE